MSGNGPPVIDGVGHYTARLIACLAARRPEWRWVWLRRKRRWFTSPLIFENHGKIVQPWHSWNRVGIGAARSIVKLLRPDIVHLQEQMHSFHETSAAAEILNASRRVTIATIHEVHPEFYGHQWTTEVIRNSQYICTNDMVTAEKCRINFGRTPDAIHWSPSSLLPPTWPVRRHPSLVVTFGFLSAIKGLVELYSALKIVRLRLPDLRWRIVGPFQPESNPHHATLASTLQGDWIEFTGGRDDIEDITLRTWIAEGTMMALPFADGASARRTTLQCAWAFGLPVVTSPPASIESIIEPGMNCLTAELDSTVLWADAIEKVLTDKSLAEHLAQGSVVTGQLQSWDNLTSAHLQFYDMALATIKRYTGVNCDQNT